MKNASTASGSTLGSSWQHRMPPQAYCRSVLRFGRITASPRDRNLIYVLFFPIVFREDRVYES
jgi:hypothetical protein